MARKTSTPGRPEDPKQVRREGLRRLQLVEAIKLDAPPLPCEVEPIRRRPGALRVAGIRARHTPTTVASIPHRRWCRRSIRVSWRSWAHRFL